MGARPSPAPPTPPPAAPPATPGAADRLAELRLQLVAEGHPFTQLGKEVMAPLQPLNADDIKLRKLVFLNVKAQRNRFLDALHQRIEKTCLL